MVKLINFHNIRKEYLFIFLDEVERREIKALMKASKELKCNDLIVITWDYEDEQKFENRKVVFKPLWKWLLEKKISCTGYLSVRRM